MGAVREDMDDERDKHRETFCFASLCYVRDHSSTDVQSRHCPSRATTVAVHKSCGGCHANAFVMPLCEAHGLPHPALEQLVIGALVNHSPPNPCHLLRH